MSKAISKRPTPQPLCLLCSSSIAPASIPKFATNTTQPKTTSCCSRVICAPCVETKGRLASWEPCLACEGRWKTGKGKGTGSARAGGGQEGGEHQFVLGDDVDEGEEDTQEADDVVECEATLNFEKEAGKGEDEQADRDVDESSQDATARRHIVLKGETLQGIALKYRLDPMTLLTLNSLPHSALYTNPHLIQTRHSILLSSLSPPSPPPEIKAQLAHERALARFAKITKEADPDVRRVYIELAEAGLTDASSSRLAEWEDGQGEKRKEAGAGAGEGEASVEHRAVDRFLEDGEWEREQLQGMSGSGGAGPKIRGFPIVGSSSSSAWTGGSKGKEVERGSSWWSRLAGGSTVAGREPASLQTGSEKGIKA